ncbi:ABC transporter permease [Candidatus Persebacteraceae bacterium Df01]|uniref:ABC transporter permease n=1 Tax=Candidatus Doriopsillibacter californiensis TaxID=2970740 RepID=A0ABT7QLM1_9GAMM|nr:ABC transporter permease [Candidatus Persebacteraceae bacterium Df01]
MTDVVNDTTLKTRFSRTERRKRVRALLLVLPLFLFICVTFLAPVAEMLFRSTDNTAVHNALTNTHKALSSWDENSGELPPQAAYLAIIADVKAGAKKKMFTRVGRRLNYQISGVSSMFRKTARQARRLPDDIADPQTALIKIHKKWGDVNIWRGIKYFTTPYTSSYYLDATDFGYVLENGDYARKVESQRVYLNLFWRTIIMSVAITLLTLLMAYPTAFLISSISSQSANLLLIMVLLPFWTSLLVRTTSWIVLLYQEGVINDLLVSLGLVSDDGRLELIHNTTGTIVAMTHILLPFMLLPLYSVMKTINPAYMRAARSMGAGAFTAFRRVYFPQTVPGIGAGAILVFILAIGYYITPELVGGVEGTFISNRIAYHVRSSGNWGLASALGFILLILVLLMYWCYDKIVGIDNMKLG